MQANIDVPGFESTQKILLKGLQLSAFREGLKTPGSFNRFSVYGTRLFAGLASPSVHRKVRFCIFETERKPNELRGGKM